MATSQTVLHDSGEALSPIATNSSSSLARSSRKTLKSRQTLPAVYTKAKNVTKRVSAQMAEFVELSERNAKHRYIEKCQQCPGYNCAFFNVRVPSAGRYIKGSVAKQLMGISNQHLVFLDEKSKVSVCVFVCVVPVLVYMSVCVCVGLGVDVCVAGCVY